MIEVNPDAKFSLIMMPLEDLKKKLFASVKRDSKQTNKNHVRLLTTVYEVFSTNSTSLNYCDPAYVETGLFQFSLITACINLSNYLEVLGDYYFNTLSQTVRPDLKVDCDLSKYYDTLLSNLTVLQEHYKTLEKIGYVKLNYPKTLNEIEAFLN